MNLPHVTAPTAKHLAIFQQFRYVFFRIVFFYLDSRRRNTILVQGQGGTSFQPIGMLTHVEEAKRGTNA